MLLTNSDGKMEWIANIVERRIGRSKHLFPIPGALDPDKH